MPSGRVFAGMKDKITITGSIAAGGVVQYINGTTSPAATGTGVLILGLQATTARGVKVDTDGTVFVSGGGGGQQYPIGGTAMGATGTGTIIIGMQLGATTGRGFLVTTTGSPIVTIDGTVPITVASLPVLSGTQTIVFGATQPISGSVSIINTPTVTIGGTASAFLLAGTAGIGGVRIIAHQSRFQSYVVATTSAAAGVIIQTSGAHTLYVTDYLVSVDGPMQVDLCSETTTLATMYLATKGGAVWNGINPLNCTSAQSFRVVCGSSGKCAINCVGYTVT